MKKICIVICMLFLCNCKPKGFSTIPKKLTEEDNNFQMLKTFNNRSEIYFGIYKLKVDSSEYIIVSTYDGVAITKHK